MSEQPKHTPGPWLKADGDFVYALHQFNGRTVNRFSASIDHYPSQGGTKEEGEANAHLIAAAPDQHQEMRRYLPVLERAESDPELWARLTEGLGIATLNGYRAAIAKAEGRGE